MHACCTGLSSNHSVPRMRGTKRAGSETHAGGGAGQIRHMRGVRAGQFAMRWRASSVAELQRRQKSVEEAVRAQFPEVRREIAGEREMDIFISIDRKIGDGGDTEDLALPLSSGDLTVKDVWGG